MIQEPAGDIPATQRVPQFRLRTLFLLIAVLAVLFAVMGTIGPIASAALLLFLCMVGLHVAGNALGTTLRDDSSARFRWQNATAIESESKPAANRSTMTAPRLSEHTPLGWIRYAIFFIGALVGGGARRSGVRTIDQLPRSTSGGRAVVCGPGRFLRLPGRQLPGDIAARLEPGCSRTA